MILAWGNKVSAAFRARVLRIAAEIGFQPSWLMAAMAFETGRTFDPAKRNPASSATGLIQFMAATARDLNTTTEALAKMSAVEQLDYVDRYFRPYTGRLKTLSDVYMAILWPAAVGKPEGAVIFPLGSQAYLVNRGLDIDHDGAVTKSEATMFVAKVLAEGMQTTNAYVYGETVDKAGDAVKAAQPIAPAPAPQEGKMGATLVMGLVQSLIGAFAPLAQQKIAAELNRHTDNPDIGNGIATNLLNAALQATGTADPATASDADKIQAVAAAQKDPAVLKTLEASALDMLSAMAPALDKIAEYQAQAAQQEVTGRDAAQARGAKDKWDSAKYLVKSNTTIVGGMVAAWAAGLTVQIANSPSHEPSVALVSLGMPIVTILATNIKEFVAYRFDGTHTSTAAAASVAQLPNGGAGA